MKFVMFYQKEINSVLRRPNIWLECHAPSAVQNEYVFMNQGLEMDRNAYVPSLIENYGYIARMAAPGISHQNYTSEIPHVYIGKGVCSLM